MSIVENVVSGLLVALVLWGARWLRIRWFRHRPAHGPDHETTDI
ncbi:hypothetical protein OG413_43085 [Streptomyces sp. NBC_01433]|nr:hypothetical protein [Streptomyces sp. NBC_01433]MCX4681980.1 hypothetical protein [Streptomyces sp. NBC_01433]